MHHDASWSAAPDRTQRSERVPPPNTPSRHPVHTKTPREGREQYRPPPAHAPARSAPPAPRASVRSHRPPPPLHRSTTAAFGRRRYRRLFDCHDVAFPPSTKYHAADTPPRRAVVSGTRSIYNDAYRQHTQNAPAWWPAGCITSKSRGAPAVPTCNECPSIRDGSVQNGLGLPVFPSARPAGRRTTSPMQRRDGILRRRRRCHPGARPRRRPGTAWRQPPSAQVADDAPARKRRATRPEQSKDLSRHDLGCLLQGVWNASCSGLWNAGPLWIYGLARAKDLLGKAAPLWHACRGGSVRRPAQDVPCFQSVPPSTLCVSPPPPPQHSPPPRSPSPLPSPC